MNIITGKTGSPHVTAQQDREINTAIFGDGNYVLSVGQKFEYEQPSSNTVRIKDGMLVMQGCAASIDAGGYEDLTIANGTQGMGRIDLICAKYEKESSTGNECVSLVVLKGTPSNSPEEPTVTDGNIRSGDSICYFPLYAVGLNGVTIQSVTAKFTVINRNLHCEKVLWSGAYYMDNVEAQVVNLSEPVSKQLTGIELVFAPYANGKALTLDYHHGFVSKEFVARHPNAGSSFEMVYGSFGTITKKFLRISNTKITGDEYNAQKGTKNGVTYDNSGFVLVEVYGV